MQEEISTSKPGLKIALPEEVLSDLSRLSPRLARTVTFFGGHPVSLRKKDIGEVFSVLNHHNQSPYLICEKTDGVRYILIVTNESSYFVSREGTKSLVAYEVYCKVAANWPPNPHLDHPLFETIVHILDGELVEDSFNGTKSFKYLIFDALVCFGDRIMDKPLKDRLACIEKFNHANKMLVEGNSQLSVQPIDVKVKDFFRLSCCTFVSSEVLRNHNICRAPTSIEFLLYYYIKCLPHENDGLIFNHEQEPYLIGPNKGYMKWKPASLNTVDFLVVPNTKLIDKFGKTILDLYVGFRDDRANYTTYRNTFYNFTVVQEDVYENIEKLIEETMSNNMEDGPMTPGVIAECKYEPVDPRKAKVFSSLLSSKKQPEEIYEDIMMKFSQEEEIKAIKKLQTLTYLKHWTIYKFRIDKNNPNDHRVVDNIEQSIRDNIKQETLIEHTYILLEKIRKGQRM